MALSDFDLQKEEVHKIIKISEELKIAYKIANKQINIFPYPHLYINNILILISVKYFSQRGNLELLRSHILISYG